MIRTTRTFLRIVVIALLAMPQAATAQSYQFHSFNAPGSADTEPYSANNSGYIGGTYYDGNGVPHAFGLNHGVLTTLDVPNGGGFSSGSGPNAQGQIALSYGSAITTDGAIYQNGSFTLLTNPTPYSQFGPTAINDSGHIAGIVASDPSYSDARGFVWNGSNVAYFDYPGAAWTYIFGLNNADSIAGFYQDGSGGLHGYQESNGTYTPIDFPGADNTTALGISNDGTVEGRYSISGSHHGYLLKNGAFTTFDFPNATDTYLTYLNSDTGELTGYYSTDNLNTIHGFYALVVPEPGAALMFAGMVVMGAILRRRIRRNGRTLATRTLSHLGCRL